MLRAILSSQSLRCLAPIGASRCSGLAGPLLWPWQARCMSGGIAAGSGVLNVRDDLVDELLGIDCTMI
jgi:hypothetical protein